MSLANSSLTDLRYAREATFGTVTAATARRKIRNTGSSYKQAYSFTDSKEIRSDRQLVDTILTSESSGGSLNYELMYQEYDDLFSAALQSSFLLFNTTGISPTLTTPTFSTNSLTQTSGTSFATIEKGQWVQVQGCTGATLGNNIVVQASLTVVATATVLTVEGTPFVAGAATGVVVIRTGRCKNGTVQPSFDFEVAYTDQTLFQTFLGQVLSKCSLSLTSKNILTGSFDFMGTSALALSATSNLPGTDNVLFPSTFDVLNASSNVAVLYEGGAPLTSTFVKSLSLDIDNGVQSQDGIANRAPVGMRSNRLSVKGKISAYFQTAALFNKFVQNTASSLAFQVKDAAGNGYVFTIPSLEWTGASLQVGSLDQDIMVDMDFTGKIDAVSGKMVIIDRFGA